MAIAGRHNPKLWAFMGPLVLLGAIAFVVFASLYLADTFLDGKPAGEAWNRVLHLDPDTLQNALGNMAQTVAAALGIVITVVSIVVQLAATRYAPRIAEMFFRDRTNL